MPLNISHTRFCAQIFCLFFAFTLHYISPNILFCFPKRLFQAVLKLIRRYSLTVACPVLALGSIYADWSHTRKWKQQKLQELTPKKLPELQ